MLWPMASRKLKKKPDDGPTAADVERILGPILRSARAVAKNPRRMLQRPRTALAKLKERIETDLTAQQPQKFVEDLLLLIPDRGDEEILNAVSSGVREQRERLSGSALGAQLLGLFDQANARGPVSPVVIFMTAPDEEMVDNFSVLGKFDVALRARGEARANALIEAAPDLLERIYQRYARALWCLTFLADGAWPSHPPANFGALVDQLVPRLTGTPTLVEPDAGHLRNAIQHRHIEYVPRRQVVEFWEKDRPGKATWRREFSVDELAALLGNLRYVAVNLTTELRSIAYSEMLLHSGMFAALPLLKRAVAGDASAVAAFEDANFEAKVTAGFLRARPPSDYDFWFLPRPKAPEGQPPPSP